MTQDLVDEFCDKLEKQIWINSKDAIVLRRSYGRSLTDEKLNMQAVSSFYKMLPDKVSRRDESICFVCAVIAAYQGTCYGTKTIGELVRDKIDSTTFESKFNYLLNLNVVDEFFYAKLYNIAKRLNLRASDDKKDKLNIKILLQDMLYWEYRSIEKESKPQKWAREVYYRKGEE